MQLLHKTQNNFKHAKQTPTNQTNTLIKTKTYKKCEDRRTTKPPKQTKNQTKTKTNLTHKPKTRINALTL